ncbi:hypothetical protein ABPG74_009077 [Tetrahymena malaccensis]
MSNLKEEKVNQNEQEQNASEGHLNENFKESLNQFKIQDQVVIENSQRSGQQQIIAHQQPSQNQNENNQKISCNESINSQQESDSKQKFFGDITDESLYESKLQNQGQIENNLIYCQQQVIAPQLDTPAIQQIEQKIPLNQCLTKQSQNDSSFIDSQLSVKENIQEAQTLNQQSEKRFEQGSCNVEQQQQNYPSTNNYQNINYDSSQSLQFQQQNIQDDKFSINSMQKQFGENILKEQNNLQSIDTQFKNNNIDDQTSNQSNILQDISSSISSQFEQNQQLHQINNQNPGSQADNNREINFEDSDEEESKIFDDKPDSNSLQKQLDVSLSSIRKANADIDYSGFLDFLLNLEENKKYSSLLEQSKDEEDFANKLKKQKQQKQNYVQIEPRDYQEEIFKNVIKNYGNYIIFLETGTGKTLVSQMIAQYTLSKFKGSKVAFLANQVNLVEQQYNNFGIYQRAIEEYLVKQNISQEINQDINIAFFHGKMNLDFWNRSFWQKNVEQSQIIFFSSQIFLNCLRRGYFQLTQFKLIIFDECHNASKEHAFSQIMKEFYFETKKNNIVLNNTPNIVGLSATPITQGNKGNFCVRKEMLKLAKNLDCQFVNYNLQNVYAQLRNIEQTQKTYEVDMFENEYQYIESNNIRGFDNADRVLYELYNQYPELKDLYNQLQILSRMDNYVSKTFTQILRKIINLLEEYAIILIYQIGVYAIQFFIFDILQELKGKNINLPQISCMKKQLEDVLQQFYDTFRIKYNDTSKHLSNKSKVLLEIISNSPGISLIFCNSKVVVKYVTKLIQSIFQNENPDQKFCEYIMGQTSQNRREEDDDNLQIVNNLNLYEINNLKQKSVEQALIKINQETSFNIKFFELKQKYQEQQKIVERFRNKQFRVLVSTSVVEEGFDIPSCNVVIAFSKIISQRQYIQMKGRARAENSKFYALVAVFKDNKTKPQNHQQVSDQIKNEYNNLSLMTPLQFQQEMINQLGNDDDDSSMENYERFIIAETNANVNTFWVKEIVHQFCQSFSYNNQLENKFPLIFNSLISERSMYLSLVFLPFQLQQNIFMNHQKLKNKKEDAQRCACMQAVKSLLKNKYISNELRPRHKSYKNFYFGRGEDDYYTEYSDKYFAIVQKHMQEVFVGYLNGKKKKIVVYKKLYRQIVDQVFVENKKIQQNQIHQFYLYEIQYKGELLQIKLIYDKQCLEDFTNPEIKFIFIQQINLNNEELNKVRSTNQQAHIKLLNLEKLNIQPKKVYVSKGLIFQKTKNKDYENTEESVILNQNVVFLYLMKDLELEQIQQIQFINCQIDKIRDFLKLQIISEKISRKLEKEKIDFGNKQITRLNVFIKPNYILTGSFSKRDIKEDQKEMYPVQFENLQTLTIKDLIQIFDKKELEKNLVFLGKQYFKFITSIHIFNDNFKTHYDILASELDMKFNDCFVMSKAVESKFFKYLKVKEYVTFAPCLSIIMQKLHTFVADDITLNEKIIVKNYKQNPLNYDMAEIRNKQFVDIIYFIIGYIINNNQNAFKHFEKYSTLFQPVLKSFGLIEKYSILSNFINIKSEETKYRAEKLNQLEQFCQNIRYKFSNIGLLQQAFTHSSYKQDMVCQDLSKILLIQEIYSSETLNDILKMEKKSSMIELNDVSNDVLSFLGSMIFSQIILHQLYSKYSKSNPNELDIFMEIVCCEQTKSYLSAKLYLDNQFLYGKLYQKIFQKLKNTADYLRTQSIQNFKNIFMNYSYNEINTLSQLFDSLVGAIFIDQQQDFEKTSKFFIYFVESIINDICKIAEEHPKYSLIKLLNEMGHSWENIQIIKLPHPEQYIPANNNKYTYQIYDIKNENLLIDNVFECQRIEEAYVAIKNSIKSNQS